VGSEQEREEGRAVLLINALSPLSQCLSLSRPLSLCLCLVTQLFAQVWEALLMDGQEAPEIRSAFVFHNRLLHQPTFLPGARGCVFVFCCGWALGLKGVEGEREMDTFPIFCVHGGGTQTKKSSLTSRKRSRICTPDAISWTQLPGGRVGRQPCASSGM
jgi:hypothetical protein